MRTPAVLLLTLTLLITASCAEDQVTTSDLPGRMVCNPGAVQINVLDGFLSRGCGCLEGNRDPQPPFTDVPCTVARGSMVVFDYMATLSSHQILSTGNGSTTLRFPDSPWRDPA